MLAGCAMSDEEERVRGMKSFKDSSIIVMAFGGGWLRARRGDSRVFPAFMVHDFAPSTIDKIGTPLVLNVNDRCCDRLTFSSF